MSEMRSDVDRPAGPAPQDRPDYEAAAAADRPQDRSATAPQDRPEDRAAFEAWQADRQAATTARAEEVDNEPACPTCNATDANPSGEMLPHCWRCGHVSDEWPPATDDNRRQATALRRLGLA